MHPKFISTTLILSLSCNLSYAAVSLETQFGIAYDSSGNAVVDGTLWILVADTNNDSNFTGFGLDSSLFQANQSTFGIADLFFTSGQSLELGQTLNGNTIFAMGGFNGLGDNGVLGLTADFIEQFNYPDFGTASGIAFAFYWFPGAIFTGGPVETIGNEVGGIHTSSNDSLFNTGMFLPSDGTSVTVGAATSDLDGSIDNSRFTAVTLIPEPSTALLGALGMIALLRRRR
jgi:hypothetical protein